MSLSLSSISSRTLMDNHDGDSSILVNPTNRTFSNVSMMGTNRGVSRLSRPADPFVSSLEDLHSKFVASIQEMTSAAGILQVMSTWRENIEEKLSLKRLTDSVISDHVYERIQSILLKEQQTWDLIIRLCALRYDISERDDEPFNEAIRDKFHFNEYVAVGAILESEKAFREINLILAWLESNYGISSYDPDLAPKPMMWEQTLQILKRDKLVNKSSSLSMVKSLDIDAPTREKKQLHALDAEEEMKVMKGAYFYLRRGEQEKSRNYLQASGHHFKACTLFGGCYTSTELVTLEEFTSHALDYIGVAKENVRDFDPKATVRPGEYTILQGNRTRDLWKKMAWQICEAKGPSKYDRACLGSLCGHRQAILDVSNTWEDKLWAYLKASLDVKIEEQLRCHTEPNNYMELPDEYWAQDLNLAECFNRLENRSSGYEQTPEFVFRSTQKSIMIEDIEGLMEQLAQNLTTLLQNEEHSIVQGHIIRFLTHLLLALGVLNLGFNENLNNSITEAYIKVLVKAGGLIFTPFYVAKLTECRQIPIIIEQIDPHNLLDQNEIDTFLAAAHANFLDILSIGTAIVEKLRLEQDDFRITGLIWISGCYSYVTDKNQVMLTFLKFILVLTRKYLTLENIPKVKALLKEVTPQCINDVIRISNEYKNTLVREYLCYAEYMEAEDNLRMWTRSKSLKPIFEEASLPPLASVADKSLWDIKRREFEAQDAKWNKSYQYHINTTIGKLMDVLQFPKGWLIDCCNEADTNDLFHINSVRCITIKKVTFMLLKLLQEKESMPLVRQFCSILCNKRQQIMKEFMKHEIGTIFKAVAVFTKKQSTNLMVLPK